MCSCISANVLNQSNENENSYSNVFNDTTIVHDKSLTTDNNRSNMVKNISDSVIDDICTLNILSLNCCGLKLRLQYPEFCELFQKYDIICLQETKTDDLDVIELPGYVFNMKNRKKFGKKSGGIVLAYKESYSNYIEVLESDSKFVLWFKLSGEFCKEGKNIICGIVYIPPEGSPYFLPDTFDQVENEIRNFSDECDYVCLIGDFNSRTASEPDFIDVNINEYEQDFTEYVEDGLAILDFLNIDKYRKSKDNIKNRSGTKLLDICKANNMFIVNGRLGDDRIDGGKLTCKNTSVIDYFMCSFSLIQFVHNFKVLDFSFLYSDVHSPLSVSLQFSVNTEGNDCQDGNENYVSQNTAKKWDASKQTIFCENIDRGKLSQLESELDNILLENIDKSKINKFVKDLGDMFIHSAKSTFGTRETPRFKNKQNEKKPRGDKPWFNYECKFARRHYRKIKRQFKFRPTDAQRREIIGAEKRYKKLLDISSKQYRKDMRNRLKNLKGSNSKEYWSILNRGTKKRQPNIPLDDLYDFFKKLNKSPEGGNTFENNIDVNIPENINIEQLNEELNAYITQEEILSCIKKLKNNKAFGEDFIVNEYIKSSYEVFLPLYEKIFNLIFDSGVIPDIWLIGNIKPIYKNKGNPFDPKNFRPITILSCLGKLFTAVLSERLCQFSDDSSLLNENQFGFRKSYSTTDSIFTLFSFFEILKNKRKKLFCAFVDFEKAFDTVWREALWHKLLLNHINGKMHNVIFNMYKDVKSCVMYNNKKSNFFDCEMGVRQGENLSPFLFAVFLNDLQNFLEQENVSGLREISGILEDKFNIFLKLFVLLYADDTVLMSESKEGLQDILNKFGTYCDTWRLKVNIDKTKIMVFSRGRQETALKFFLNGKELEIVNEFNYLGIQLNRTGNFNKAINKQTEKATKAMYEVLKKGRIHNLSIECQIDLFNKIVKPILLYGSEIWGFSKNIRYLEKVQLRFCKLLLKLKSSTPNYMVYGELGIYPLEIDIKVRMISYWCRLLSGKETKLPYICYKLQHKLFIDDHFDFLWIQFIKKIFDDTGFSNIWMNQNFPNSDWLTAALKLRLTDQFQQHWLSQIEDSSKALNYRLFKSSLVFENFLNVLEDKDIFTFLKFRTTNHRLPVETGRWNGTEHENRICTKCNNGIGDEYHFIMECKSFLTERKKFIDKIFYQRPNVVKFNQVMNSSDKVKLEKLCRFIRIINKSFVL